MNRPPTRLSLHEMDPRTWSHLDSILDQVLDLPVHELGPTLARLCGGDHDLEERIRSILAADLAVEGYLSRTARQGLIQAAAAGLDAELPALEGRLLGPWRVLQPIARGGMGVVYLGERADGAFEQRVAIKFLGRGITTPAALARFRQERQILARLEDPHIARLVDGGVTDDGLWWFAMEFVDGSPITEWCASRGLSTRPILELFQQACGAVQMAHRNLIVHRDLKPSNIMVSADGDVKLLDFGIAKMLEEEEVADRSFATSAAMTPNYASPEQIRGEPPTTATDVYALGVVLYELLTGERPHRPKTGTFEDVRHAVLEEEPEAPSARIRRRRGEAKQIPRELDAIVLTAIRKEPEGRYPSVEALSEDVQRHLDGRPVRASGRTFGYLASKFLRRNRVPVAATLMVLLALSAGLYATARERDRARLEAARARELKEFALGLFRVSNPEEGGRPDVTARELLDRGAARVDREIRDPRVKAEMWDMLASVYQSLDLFPSSISMCRRAIALRRAHPERPDTLLANSLRQLGSALNENGNYEEGERVLREALAMERRTFGEVHPRVGFAMGELAILENRMGHTAQAESLYLEVIRVDSLTNGMEHRNTASDLSNLGMHYYGDGRYREAVPYIARALAIRERLFGRDHIETATGIDQLGLALVGVGAADSGLALMSEALTIRRHWLAPDHPDIAHSLLNIGATLAAHGRLPEAERDLREALARRRRMLDPKNPSLAHTHNELAIVFYREGALDSAAAHFDEALRIWAYSLPSDHGDVLTTRGNLAVVYREMGRYAPSEKLLREVLAARLRFEKPGHLDVAAAEYHLGRLLVMTKRPEQGIPFLRRADASRSAALDADDPRVAEVRLALGNGLIAAGQVREGRALIRASLENAEKRLGARDRMVVLAKTQGR
jgi:serine/threonine protein kinase/Tfp pilus assembly protein PilF